MLMLLKSKMGKKTMADSTENEIILCLEKNRNGCSITEIVSKTKLSRSAVRTALAKLSGERIVSHKNIGIAKVYFIRGKEND